MIHKIKALHDEGKGLSIRAIAHQLKLSRNTVKKYLGMEGEAIAAQQSERCREHLLDVHRTYLVHLLKTFPQLSAVKIMRRLRERHPDIAVSDRTVRRYVQQLRATVTCVQPRYYEPVLDMTPGLQCQVDGGELRGVLIGGVETTVYFMVFVLSYSRRMAVGLSKTPINTLDLIRMHDAAFRDWGGCPEECVYDQTKLVVLNEEYRELDLNPRFHGYATLSGFRIRVCEGYDPESKGKVEAGVKYVKQNALYGETFEDWPSLEAYLADWVDTIANQRLHGSTGEAPALRYERDERARLKPYLTPVALLQGRVPAVTRQVDKTGLLAWKANKYSAPMIYQRSRVGVEEKADQLVLSDPEQGTEIARHPLHAGKGQVIRNTDHYRDKAQQVAELERAIAECLSSPDAERLCRLLKQTSPRIYKDQLAGLKHLLASYTLSAQQLSALCQRPRLTVRGIRDYLEAYAIGLQRTPLASLETEPDHYVSNGSLTAYNGLHTRSLADQDLSADTEVDHVTVH